MFAQTVIRGLSRLCLDQRGTDPHPRQPAPLLLQKADTMFSSPDWTYEPKWDGFCALVGIRGGAEGGEGVGSDCGSQGSMIGGT